MPGWLNLALICFISMIQFWSEKVRSSECGTFDYVLVHLCSCLKLVCPWEIAFNVFWGCFLTIFGATVGELNSLWKFHLFSLAKPLYETNVFDLTKLQASKFNDDYFSYLCLFCIHNFTSPTTIFDTFNLHNNNN